MAAFCLGPQYVNLQLHEMIIFQISTQFPNDTYLQELYSDSYGHLDSIGLSNILMTQCWLIHKLPILYVWMDVINVVSS